MKAADPAEDRTERLRTAFGAPYVGLAIEVLFGKLDPPWLARAVASLLIR